jgi:imidazolonepropionase|tara:strand:+ start:236 stop:1477 length:1242 start_codon:yes stop_codon:yes gene_type:complete
MKVLFKNIKELLQVRKVPVTLLSGSDMNILPTLKNAYLIVQNGLIAEFGSMEACPSDWKDEEVDANGKMVLPTWCDSHTHIVYTGNRENEFVDRINGLSYEEIAKNGGGILNSAKQLEKVSEDQLYEESKKRLEEVIKQGTGAIEIKSGYGLTVEAELKMLRVIRKLKKNYELPIKATFLGAHAVPNAYVNNKKGYIKLLIDELLPVIAKEQLAEYIDVFCEKGYFTAKDTGVLLKAGQKHGLIPKIHVNQFNAIGGIQVGVEFNALSVDHLEIVRSEDIESLRNTSTISVALPNCAYFLGIPYTPARSMIDAGLPLAIASDYNPGSAPSGNMSQVAALACIKMNMTPEEVINAATINGAYAMGLENEMGSITIGKRANLILTKEINSYSFLFYAFGTDHIDSVYINGKRQNG